jgi:hypothetical protein
MIRKKMLGVLVVVGGLVVLTAQPSGARVLTSGDGERVLVSSEKAAFAALPPRPRAAHRHWRHRGGRHPFYGSGH